MLILGILSLFVSTILLLFRIIKGPEIQDRIIAADALMIILALIIILLAVLLKEAFLYDLCMVYALLAFVDVIIMAKYFEHGELHK